MRATNLSPGAGACRRILGVGLALPLAVTAVAAKASAAPPSTAVTATPAATVSAVGAAAASAPAATVTTAAVAAAPATTTGSAPATAAATTDCPDPSTIEGVVCLARQRDETAVAAPPEDEREAYLQAVEQAYEKLRDVQAAGLVSDDELRPAWEDFLSRYPADHPYGNPHAAEVHCELEPKTCFDGLEPNLDGTVFDHATGLLWQLGDAGKALRWTAARGYCRRLVLARASDWRLPDIGELAYLYDRMDDLAGGGDDRRLAPFEWSGGAYWSSTEAGFLSNGVEILRFDTGAQPASDEDHGYAAARCVRRP